LQATASPSIRQELQRSSFRNRNFLFSRPLDLPAPNAH